MSTLSINQLTVQQKVNILAKVSELLSEGETEWVSFDKKGISVYPFHRRLDSFDVEGLQEIYMVNHDEVRFLGFLIEQDWVELKQLKNEALKVAILACRKVKSGM